VYDYDLRKDVRTRFYGFLESFLWVLELKGFWKFEIGFLEV